MGGRPGSGAEGQDPHAPQDDGLSIFGPLELPRDETDYHAAYEEPQGYGGGYPPYDQAPGGTRVATPSMLVPPDPGMPGAPGFPPAGPPPAYPGGPPPGYPPPVPPGPQPYAAAAPPPAPPAPEGFPDMLFRPGPSSGPASAPVPGYGAPHHYPAVPPGPGQPQYSAPAMPQRRADSGLGSAASRGGPPRGVLIIAVVGAAAVLLAAGLFASGALSDDDKAKNAGGAGTSAGQGSGSPAPASPSPSPPKPTKSQAQQMDELLQVSAGSRNKVGEAVRAIERCDDIDTAVQTLNDAAAQRDQQVQALAALQTDQFSRGAELTGFLRQAWEASARADRAYAAWGQESAEDSCEDGRRAKSTDNRKDADAASREATTAKAKAVALWNPEATKAGLSPRTANEI